jgi:hypothetical protein
VRAGAVAIATAIPVGKLSITIQRELGLVMVALLKKLNTNRVISILSYRE